MRGILPTLVLLLAWVPNCAAEDALSKRMQAKPDETCVVCNQATKEGDAAYLCGGQRVAVHAADCCEGEFLKDPAKYTAAMRPNNMIMTGEERTAMSSTWIWVGLLALLGLMLAGFVAQAVARIPKGTAKVRLTHDPVPCPGCGHLNHPAATSCARCREPLKPGLQSEVARSRDSASS